MKKLFKLNLQMFANGEGEGGNPISNPDEGGYDEDLGDNVDTPQSDDVSSTIVTEPEGEVTPGEEEFIPKGQVSKIVSDRVNKLNEKYKDHDKYKGTLDKLVRMSGLTEDQFYAQLNEVELQEQAKRMGVSPEVAKQIQDSQKALEESKRVTMDMKFQMEEQSLLTNPLYYGYNDIKDNVRQLAMTSLMSLEQSYWALKGPELLKEQTKMAEQRVTHNQQYKQKRGTVENDGNSKTPQTPGASLDDNQRHMAKSMGLSADEYAIYNNDDLDYDKIMEMKRNQKK